MSHADELGELPTEEIDRQVAEISLQLYQSNRHRERLKRELLELLEERNSR